MSSRKRDTLRSATFARLWQSVEQESGVNIMQKERSVYLNETGEWLLFRAMVCEALDKTIS
ncbi:UNVERIFIED_ASMBLY: hypothetical protein SD1_36 [Shigella phage 2019SD1]|uniref:Uncharacterized protein n=1 Tax=Shigella phage 2019SD1 TaxID=2848074 RepID=A0A6M5CAU7_9CAUD|nr:hypothetical protein H1N84_gp36 [Shigella phage 2019SD1]